jgi:hypothetical protein
LISVPRKRRELSVDESLVGTKGKTSMLQYIPSKRSGFGVKFWMLVESVTGYALQMSVYQGKRFDFIICGICLFFLKVPVKYIHCTLPQ